MPLRHRRRKRRAMRAGGTRVSTGIVGFLSTLPSAIARGEVLDLHIEASAGASSRAVRKRIGLARGSGGQGNRRLSPAAPATLRPGFFALALGGV